MEKNKLLLLPLQSSMLCTPNFDYLKTPFSIAFSCSTDFVISLGDYGFDTEIAVKLVSVSL